MTAEVQFPVLVKLVEAREFESRNGPRHEIHKGQQVLLDLDPLDVIADLVA